MAQCQSKIVIKFTKKNNKVLTWAVCSKNKKQRKKFIALKLT